LAVRIVRQPKKIALIGAPSSAASFCPGGEKAPAALRAAGLVERLQNAGFEVIDHGDGAPRLFADDEEHRRARNLTEIVAGLNDLRTRAEVAVKSGALVLVLGGDCAQIIGLLAAARRYYKHLNLLWFDRDADLNTPATTPSGRIDGMVVAHIIGKGAPELVRFWGEPPLVREPDVTLFALDRVDPPEQYFLTRSAMRRVYAADIAFKGAAKSAQEALAHMHADSREFFLHLDLDAIRDADFPANFPGDGGLPIEDVSGALAEFVRHKNLLGFDVAQYNPDKDPDGSAARKLVGLIVAVCSARLAPESPAEPASLEQVASSHTTETNIAETAEPATPPASTATESTETHPSESPGEVETSQDGPDADSESASSQ
jgi:arginase